jgi:hypothetical protein
MPKLPALVINCAKAVPLPVQKINSVDVLPMTIASTTGSVMIVNALRPVRVHPAVTTKSVAPMVFAKAPSQAAPTLMIVKAIKFAETVYVPNLASVPVPRTASVKESALMGYAVNHAQTEHATRVIPVVKMASAYPEMALVFARQMLSVLVTPPATGLLDSAQRSAHVHRPSIV